jgi:hypothetical protein
VIFVVSFERSLNDLCSVKRKGRQFRPPAWRAGIQIDMDVSEASMHTWMPAIHAGVTSSGLSSSVSERKLMNHFVVR